MMLKRCRTLRLGAVVAVALTAAACGSTANTTGTTDAVDSTAAEETGELPRASVDDAGDTPVVAGVCAPGEPDCEDTLVDDSEVMDLPSTSDDGPAAPSGEAASSGMIIDGGLTISEALNTDATGILAVEGHLFDDGTGPQLCEGLIGLGERYGCDGEHIGVLNLNLDGIGASLVFHEGLSYTEDPLTLFGELVDGSLVVSNLVTG